MNRFARALDSPLFLFPLVFAVSAMGVTWQGARVAASPPDLSRYDWGKHPNALLISVPSGDCGCGIKPAQVAKTAVERGLDVVVVATAPTEETARVEKAGLPPGRVALFTDVDASVVSRFSPEKGVGAALIRDGRITHRVEGNLPENFFDLLKKEV